jgi:hypothetical protein
MPWWHKPVSLLNCLRQFKTLGKTIVVSKEKMTPLKHHIHAVMAQSGTAQAWK